MSIKTYKPTTPSRRHMSVSGFDGVDKHAKPQKELVEVLKKQLRPQQLRPHHRPPSAAAATSSKYRVIDFKRDKMDVPATVLRLEYDPNRSANIALVEYEDGEQRYILAPVGLNAGRQRRVLRRGGYQARQRPAARQHPGRYRDPQHRAAPRQGRSAGPLRRRRRAADGEGRR